MKHYTIFYIFIMQKKIFNTQGFVYKTIFVVPSGLSEEKMQHWLN